MDKEILIIDTETGGLNPDTDALCSVCLKKYGSNKKLYVFIKPNPNSTLFYKKEAMEINNLNKEQLEREGLSEGFVVDLIITYIKEYFVEKPILLGQNILFDISFLKELFSRNNENFGDYVHYHYLDTLVITNTLKFAGIIPENISPSLGKAHEFFCGGTDIKKTHSADYDVKLTEELFKKQLELLENCRVENG